MSSDLIKLFDRVKESSYSLGTATVELEGALPGFSPFSDRYSDNDPVFYALTDGTNYEVGSGIFQTGPNRITRFPIRSNNNDQAINLGQGLKEVYVTYPADHSVTTGSGIGDFSVADASGVAFWASSNTLDYDSRILWDKTEGRLGIRASSPQYAIQVGGNALESSISASGYVVGSSGVYFPPQNNGDANYVGGQQLTHYEMNEVDSSTGADNVISLSGDANHIITFIDQPSNSLFAGPVSGVDQSPSFRTLHPFDIPDISDTYATIPYVDAEVAAVQNDLAEASGNLDNARTFTVTESANRFIFSGVGTDADTNPDVRLQKGFTYKFNVVTSGTPFYIVSGLDGSTPPFYNDGVTNNGTSSGVITFVPPMDSPDILYYQTVGVHSATASGNMFTGDGIVSDPTNIGGASGVNNLVVMTSGAYAVLPRYEPNTIYFISE